MHLQSCIKRDRCRPVGHPVGFLQRLNNRVLTRQGQVHWEESKPHRLAKAGVRATVGAVDLDAEVTVLTTRFVAGGKDDAADGLAIAAADLQIGGGRRGED